MSEHQPASRSAFPSSGRQRAQVSRAVPSSAPAGATLSRPVTIAGGGSIGVAWALVFARGRRQVTLFEPDAGRRRLVPDELQRRLEALAAAGLTDEARRHCRSRTGPRRPRRQRGIDVLRAGMRAGKPRNEAGPVRGSGPVGAGRRRLRFVVVSLVSLANRRRALVP